MTTLVLAPGWGFDGALWNGLRAALPELEAVVWECGAARPVVIPSTSLDSRFRGNDVKGETWAPLIAVGHSLGLLWLLRLPVPWRAVVSINGFTRFTAAPDFPQGLAPRLLKRMRRRFTTAPEEVWREFMRRCGVEASEPSGLDHARLADGLGWLAEWDERRRPMASRVLALAGGGDAIVPPAMTRACFPDAALRWQPHGGHALPLTHPDWCAAEIRRFLREVAP